ncbi:ABC transporter ATP-binding protein [Kallotenue papyrolyticum]|uniref:ABC transporter ATP-binding protein n=1 Tax=Kallotenue papyrolyticum TaxID=1325125 RepID=UPI00047864CE|nr:ABC transporter ATP-binding protein [Kallotenue papyrolyticum]
MHNLRPLWPYVWRYRWLLGCGLVVAALSAIFSAIPPFLLGRAVGDLQRGGIELGLIGRYAVLILGAAALDSLFKFGTRQLINGTSYRIEYDLRNDLFRNLLRLEQEFYSHSHTGDLMARATNDLSAVRQMLGPGLMAIASSGLLFVVVMTLLVRMDLQLGLLVTALLPLISITFVVLGQRMRQRFREVQDQFGRISTRAQEVFSGIRTIKAYAQEDAELGVFAAANREYQRLNLRYVLLSALIWPLMTLLMSLTVALVLLVGGQAVASGRLTLDQFVSFNAYLALLSWPVIQLGWMVTLVQQGSASMQRIAEVLQRAPQIRTAPEAVLRTRVEGEIEFRDVGVRYGQRWVLRHISLRIPRGSTTAIVGATGAGKTTLVNLIGRVLDPSEGQVLVDGLDVRRWPLEVLRAGISYVPQDTFLFSIPLRENVTFGCPDADDATIMRAVEVSQLINDLPQFPHGLDTLLGERGVTLSGGQKQRAAIARAVLRDAPILILDDAMSSVDTHTAARILQRLRDVLQDRTAIIIAQRIATVKDADHIVVLHNGAIVEQGTHLELLRHNGRYAAMYRRELLQAELDESDASVTPERYGQGNPA